MIMVMVICLGRCILRIEGAVPTAPTNLKDPHVDLACYQDNEQIPAPAQSPSLLNPWQNCSTHDENKRRHRRACCPRIKPVQATLELKSTCSQYNIANFSQARPMNDLHTA
jgi:hypothetical protein